MDLPVSVVIFQQLGISLLLGLLVGLQRQHAVAGMPGVRTFPLITVFGTVSALLAIQFGGWIVVAGLFGVVAVLVFPNLVKLRKEEPEPENPTQLKSALFFGVMYAVVLFALAAARKYLGDEALYVVAGLSGLTDMDAITLSTARMFKSDPVAFATGWRLIIVAALANLVFKAGLIGVFGNRRLLGQIALLFAVPMIGGLLLIFLWPW